MNSKPFSLTWWALLLSTIAGVIAGVGPAVELLPPDWHAPVRAGIGVSGILVALVLRSALFDSNGNGTPDALERPPASPPSISGPGAAALVLLAFATPLAIGALVGALLSGCGATAQRSTATAACSTLLIAIGEADGIEPERAEADRQIVHEVCVRYVGRGLDAGVDAGGGS